MKKRILKFFIVIALLSMFCFSGCDSPVSNDNSNSPASQLTSGTVGNAGNPSETVYSYDKLCNKIICECVSQGCSIQQIAEDATFANLYEKFADKQDIRENDILFVNDGTFLIGRSAMVTSLDNKIIIQSHLKKIRRAMRRKSKSQNQEKTIKKR